MEERILGKSDLSVSVFGLGTMTFGAETDQATSHAMLDRFVAAGGTFIDTADVYSRGAAEEIVGGWLAGNRRDDVVLATKGRFPMSDDPRDRGAGRDYLNRALEASLRRLGVDTIDLYQIHAWDPATPIEETLETLNEFVVTGKVREIGVSNFLAWQLERALQVGRFHGWAPIVSLQPLYNLISREVEFDLLPLCIEHDLGVLPWSPLGGGWLTGKYRREESPTGATRLGEDPDRGVEAYAVRNNELTWRVLEAVEAVATDRRAPMSQVALNWLRGRPAVSSVLLGCRTVEQLEENLGALEWDLTDEEKGRLDKASAPGIPTYPYGFLEVEAKMDVWRRLSTRTRPPFGPGD
jgi:aryl-alcohol dehydrogenase-like predicted oxidoreductase